MREVVFVLPLSDVLVHNSGRRFKAQPHIAHHGSLFESSGGLPGRWRGPSPGPWWSSSLSFDGALPLGVGGALPRCLKGLSPELWWDLRLGPGGSLPCTLVGPSPGPWRGHSLEVWWGRAWALGRATNE